MIVEVHQTDKGFVVIGPDGEIIIDRYILEQIEFSVFTPPVAYFEVTANATNTSTATQNTIHTNVALR